MAEKQGFSKYKIAFMVVPLLAVASLHVFPAPLLWLTWAGGGTGECPLDLVFEVQARTERQNEFIRQLMEETVIREPDESGLALWETPLGEFWAPPETPVHLLLSEQTQRFYGDGPRRVQPGDIVLDCGANVGTFVWEALDAGAAKVIAVEPTEINIAALRRNFAEEIETGQVVVYPKGVWSVETELEFYSYDNTALDSAVMAVRRETAREPTVVKVPVTTVDKILAELGLDSVDFIKMDVEGAELEALQGARRTIRANLPAMAIATENLKSHQYEVPKWVADEFPAYEKECGWCSVPGENEIRADVFYFFADSAR